MQGRIFAGLFLCSLFFVVGGDAQSRDKEKPVWTMEFIKLKPENFGPAMGYLDYHWMGVRAEAKNRGAVLDYHIIQNVLIQDAVLARPGERVDDLHSIVLLTEYKNRDAFRESQKVFAAMRAYQLAAGTRRTDRRVEYPSVHRRTRNWLGVQASYKRNELWVQAAHHGVEERP